MIYRLKALCHGCEGFKDFEESPSEPIYVMEKEIESIDSVEYWDGEVLWDKHFVKLNTTKLFHQKHVDKIFFKSIEPI